MSTNANELLLQPRKRKLLQPLRAGLFFLVTGIYVLAHPSRAGLPGAEIAGWAAIVFFALGVVVIIGSLVPGSTYLKLEERGFTVSSLFKRRSYRWDQVERFQVSKIFGNKSVGFNWAASYQSHPFLRKFNAQIAGFEGSLTDHYQVSPEELAQTMNGWRRRAVFGQARYTDSGLAAR